jgi:hypothetical protein
MVSIGAFEVKISYGSIDVSANPPVVVVVELEPQLNSKNDNKKDNIIKHFLFFIKSIPPIFNFILKYFLCQISKKSTQNELGA